MFLKTLSIQNFRAISSIEVDFVKGVNVIVGPNATGKTTILEAIRLSKAILAQRSQSEAQQTLMSLGAVSPHAPQQIIAESLVQNLQQDLQIRCGYQLTENEYNLLNISQAQIATNLVQARLGPQTNPAAFTAFLSSPAGIAALNAAETEIREGLKILLSSSRVCRLDLQIDFKAGRMFSPDPIGAAFISFLDHSLPPDQTKFSYFPADRALPRGEVAVQLGTQDALQQIESHNSQPQLKYNRLKNTIFSTIIATKDGRGVLDNEFKKIFGGVLKGRELVGAGINQNGLLSITIRDIESGRQFDIDGLSSGEKGLVLTFLLIGRTVSKDGIVLLDEPELHLNPAVCKDLLEFIVDHYATLNDIQFIICTHSPEILAGAFGHEECTLYHLVSGNLLTKVRQSDEEEISEALRRLGTSESEGLLYRANIFVEGEHDLELLSTGFGSLLRNFKLKDLGGRNEVEKQIRFLQDAESRGKKITPQYFIFDRDAAPTSLQSTNSVKLLQWTRRCFENYLIDIDALTDLLQDSDIARNPVRNSGEVISTLKTLALKHLDDEIIKTTYEEYKFEGMGRRPNEVTSKTFSDAGNALFSRIEIAKSQVESLNRQEWIDDFSTKCEARKAELQHVWGASWKELCDGKRLFKELQISFPLKLSLLNFKKRVVLKMAGQPPSENWRLIESLLKGLLASDESGRTTD